MNKWYKLAASPYLNISVLQRYSILDLCLLLKINSNSLDA